MKKLLAMLVVLCLALPLAACGSSGSSSKASGSNAGGGDAALKDTITWVQGADVTSLDPHVGKETPAVMVTVNMFDTLLSRDAEGKPAPNLAEKWENVDELTWKFKLREDVTFHDGSKMTAEDVKFSLDRAIASNYVSYVVDFIDTVTVDDDYNITIKTKAPYGPILFNLAVPFTAIVPKAVVEADPDGFKLHPVGSGPYKFVEWKQGESVKMEAFDGYWGGVAKTKNIQMKVVPEPAQRLIALENGEVDLAYEIAPNDMSKVKENDKLQLMEAPSLSVFYLIMNNEKEPFTNVKVRQAIRYAIDQQLIVDSLLYGAGQPANSLIPPAAFGFSENSKAYQKDIEKAKALMKEAGYENGFTCELSVSENPIRQEICQVLQSQLKEIGITVEIKVLEFGSWVDQIGTGAHEMSFAGWTCSTGDADYTYYPIFHSSQVGFPGNDAFFRDPKVDELVVKGRETADTAERQAIYDELETYLGEVTPYAPIYYSNVNVGASANVRDFVVEVNGYHRMHNVTVLA